MSIAHKFLNTNFGNGFETHNAILDVTPYKPEVLILGTFNHGWDWNEADFFYGRDMYLWTIFANMFLHNSNVLTAPRSAFNDIPNINQIKEICTKGKITFADIVLGTRHEIHTENNEREQSIIVDHSYEWKGYGDKCLDDMGVNNWLIDNVDNIIKYIHNTPSIRHVYFTFKTGGWLVLQKSRLESSLPNRVSSCSIFTPTGMGFRENLPAPFNKRAWSIAHCWVWNGLVHPVPINKPGYGHLNHEWLIRNGVIPMNF